MLKPSPRGHRHTAWLGARTDGRRAARCLCHFDCELRVNHHSGVELNQDDRGVRVRYHPRRRQACPCPGHQPGRRFRGRCVGHQRPIDDNQEGRRWVPGHRLRRRDMHLHPSGARRSSQRLALQQHAGELCRNRGVAARQYHCRRHHHDQVRKTPKTRRSPSPAAPAVSAVRKASSR